MQILLVEDNEIDVLLVEEALRTAEEDIDITHVETLKQCLKHLDTHSYDAALLDLGLPDSQGMDTIIKFKQHSPKLPLIALTGLDEVKEAINTLKAGAQDFISKNDLDGRVILRSLRYAIERCAVQNKIEEMQSRYIQFLNASPAVIYATTLNGDNQCNFASENLKDVTGYDPEDMINVANFWYDHLHPEDKKDVNRKLLENLKKGHGVLEYRFRHKKGEYMWVHDSFKVLYKNNTPVEVVGSWTDITPTKKLSQELSYQSRHDNLTGLINRREFENRVQQVINLAHLDGVEHTLFYIDLDQFKIINDTSGHVAGDELIKQLAKVISKKLRRNDTFARLGGDEFGIIIEYCNLEESRRIAQEVLDTIQSHRFMWQDKSFPINASVGVVEINENTNDIVTVMRNADAACYMAKEKKTGAIHYYDDSIHEVSERRDEMHRVAQIRLALEEDRFELHFQCIKPILPNGEGKHFEVLVRMRDEKDQLVPPGLFLPAAEKYNLIQALDKWVITTAIKWLADHPHFLEQTSVCAINLSGQSMNDENTMEIIKSQLEKYGIPAKKLCFEVTETAAIGSLNSAIRVIEDLKDMGCRFALDDFGSGFSSFSYLQTLPVDYLKIDGSFVKNIDENKVNYAMVRSINELGHATGKKTIAEFVENDNILTMLAGLGVDYAQGFGIAKPLPLTDFGIKCH